MESTRKYILTIMLGVLVGVLTLIGQKYLPMNLNFLANSGAVWLIPAVIMKIIIGVILYLVVNRKDAIKLKNIISYVVITAFGIIDFTILTESI